MNTKQAGRPTSSGGEPSTPLFGSISELDAVLGPNWNAMDPATTQMLLNLDEENHYLLKHDPMPLGDHELHVPTFSEESGRGQHHDGNAQNKRKATDALYAKNRAASQEGRGEAVPGPTGGYAQGTNANVKTNADTNATTNTNINMAGKKQHLSKEAAVAKADRERKRRERLNKCFEELSQACAGELGDVGSAQSLVKTDRMSIIVDAIRVVKALRVEVNQLRQLNKLMEERVGQLERGRMAEAYSSYTRMRGMGTADGDGAGPSGIGGHQGGHGGHGLHGGHGGHGSGGSYGHPGHGNPVMGTVVHHNPYQPDILAQQSFGVGNNGTGRLEGQGNVSYLPPSNLSEDEKLRPPAA